MYQYICQTKISPPPELTEPHCPGPPLTSSVENQERAIEQEQAEEDCEMHFEKQSGTAHSVLSESTLSRAGPLMFHLQFRDGGCGGL